MRMFGWMALAAVLAALAFAAHATSAELLPAGVTEDTLSPEPALVSLPVQPILFVRLKTVRNTPESRDLISSTFKRIWAFARARGIKVVGSPLEIMARYEEADGSWLLSAAIPVAPPAGMGALTDSGDIILGEICGGDAAQAAHRGDHDRIKDTHARIAAFLSAQGLQANGRIAEQHFDDPHKVPAEKLRSAVTFFLK